MKECTKCHKSFGIEEFHKGAYYCKECESIRNKAYYSSNRGKVRERARAYYATLPTEIKRAIYKKQKQQRGDYADSLLKTPYTSLNIKQCEPLKEEMTRVWLRIHHRQKVKRLFV